MTPETPPPDASVTLSEFERTAVTSVEVIPGYELQASIGRGGFGEVFQARQIRLDRVVALKVVGLDRVGDPAAAARFELEAVTLGRLNHPNVVPLYDFGRTETQMYLAMECLEGEDLSGLLARVGRLDERTAWGIARQAAAGLAHAAAVGVVHRDVKPANLFLVAPPAGVELPPGVPMVKVTDFGLARAKWSVDPGAQQRTAPGVMLGTPAYMAPEQQRGEPVDERADIYALGATVCHALLGRPPFEGRTVWALMARKLENTPRGLPIGSEASARLVAAMTEADPAKRLASYDILIRRIDELLATPTLGQPTRRRRPRLALAALTAAAVAAAAAVPMTRGVRAVPAAGVSSYVTAGESVSLFQGDSLERWSSVPGYGGRRGLERDDEKTAVLSLTGGSRLTFPTSAAYRLRVGLDLHDATSAELQFGFAPPGPHGPAPRLALHISRADGVQFGRRVGDRGPLQSAGGVAPFPTLAPDRRPYVEVRVERTPGWWEVAFDGRVAGRVPDGDTISFGELRLLIDGGAARVDMVEIDRLRPAGPPGDTP